MAMMISIGNQASERQRSAASLSFRPEPGKQGSLFRPWEENDAPGLTESRSVSEDGSKSRLNYVKYGALLF